MSIRLNEERDLFWDELTPQLQEMGIEVKVNELIGGKGYRYFAILDKDKRNNVETQLNISRNYKDEYNTGIPTLWVLFKEDNALARANDFISSLRTSHPELVIDDPVGRKKDYKVTIRRRDEDHELDYHDEVSSAIDVITAAFKYL